VGIHSEKKLQLTRLLHSIAGDLARSGDKEAKSLVPQILAREIGTIDYLLNSAFGTVWTIELPPAERDEFRDQILPSLFTADLGTTDLYGDVETFKKNVIYGLDSLASLAYATRQKMMREAEHPESFQTLFSFEPIKGRLLYAGRIEEVERDLDTFGSALMSQVWDGYLDNLLGETNLSLAALGYWYDTTSSEEEIVKLKDGEVEALWQNLADYKAAEPIIRQIAQQCKFDLQSSKRTLRSLHEQVRPIVSHGKGLLNAFLTVNTENLQNLTGKLAEFEELFDRMDSYLATIYMALEKEHRKRFERLEKRRHRLHRLYLPFMGSSLVFILFGSGSPLDLKSLLLFGGATLIQGAYVGIYYTTLIRRRLPDKYPNTLYHRLQTNMFTLVGTLHTFTATADILRPAEVMPTSKSEKLSPVGEEALQT
jgi:hypothetical protein